MRDNGKNTDARMGHGHSLSTSSATISPGLFTPTNSTLLRLRTPVESSTPDSAPSSRGLTEFRPLMDDHVVWEHAVEVVVQIPIDRSIYALVDDELPVGRYAGSLL